MLKTKEIGIAAVIIIILTAGFSILKTTQAFLYSLLAIFLVFTINIIAKKISSFYLDSEIEIKLWEIKQYGFVKGQHFKKPFPAGIFFPIIIAILSLGKLMWMACLVFDVKAKTYKSAKRHGLYSYSSMTEKHIGLIAAIGVITNLVFAIASYFAGFPEFARLNIYFAFFNLIPLSDLDGNKIFFGSLVLWTFLATITLIGLGYAFFLI